MLGIYYFDYCANVFPKSARKLIIGYTRTDLLERIEQQNIPDEWFCWITECRTPGYLIDGKKQIVIDWINRHMPDEFGEPLRNQNLLRKAWE